MSRDCSAAYNGAQRTATIAEQRNLTSPGLIAIAHAERSTREGLFARAVITVAGSA